MHVLTSCHRRGRELRARPDAGITLTELLVTMGLSTIIGALTLMLFVHVDDSTSATTDRTIGAAQARIVMQAWSAYLGVADGPSAPGSTSHRFEWVTPSSTVFYANLENRPGTSAVSPPTMIWLRLDTAH